MATYKSEVVSLAYPAETVFGKLSNLEGFGGILKNVPADKVPADQLAITPLTPETCESYVQIDIQIPAMLKPMVNGPLQKMADQIAQMLRQVPMA